MYRKEFTLGRDNQSGINMVDLMMWLVIAALLLAAAIQGIGFYQKATFVYQAKSDLNAAHSWTLQRMGTDSKVPTSGELASATSAKELSLTENGGKKNTAVLGVKGASYCIGIRAVMLEGDNLFYSTSEDPTNIQQAAELPDSCGGSATVPPVEDFNKFLDVETVPALHEVYSLQNCKLKPDNFEVVRCAAVGYMYGKVAGGASDSISKKMFETKNPNIGPVDLAPKDTAWHSDLIGLQGGFIAVISDGQYTAEVGYLSTKMNELASCGGDGFDYAKRAAFESKLIAGGYTSAAETQAARLEIVAPAKTCGDYIRDLPRP